MQTPPTAVPLRTKLAFGVGATGEAIQYTAFNVFALIYFNQVLGLSGTLSGLVTTIALVFDALSDPVVGSISDRWHSKRMRLGRRHPFMYAATAPAALCFFALFCPPPGLGEWALFGWLTLFAVLLRLSTTLFIVPNLALGAELSPDYIQRTSVMSYHSVLGYLGGGLFWLVCYLVIFRATPEYSRGVLNPDGYPVFAVVGALMMLAALFLSAWHTRDVIPRLPEAPGDVPRFEPLGVVRDVAVAFRNPNYRALLLGLVCLSGSLGIHETLHLHVQTFFFELTSAQIVFWAFSAPIGFVGAFALTPRINARFDKRPTMVVATAALAIFQASPVSLRLLGLLPENGSTWLLPALLFLSIFPIFAGSVLHITVMSALADIADESEVAHGRRQEAIFYSARTFFAKSTSGLGHLLGGIGLDLIAFPENATPGEVSASAITQLGVIEGPVAAIPGLIAVFFYARYRIDRTRHAAIRSELDSRARAADPTPAGHPETNP